MPDNELVGVKKSEDNKPEEKEEAKQLILS